MSTRQVGEFTVTAVSDGVLYSNHDVILGVPREESAKLTGIAYGQPLPLDVNSFLIRHRGKLILSDAGTGQGLQPVQKNLGKLPENLRALGAPPEAIDIIMLTHLHSDHSLGLVDEQGKAVFPRPSCSSMRSRRRFGSTARFSPAIPNASSATPTSSERRWRRTKGASDASGTARCCPASPPCCGPATRRATPIG
jgi:glyoxylase-like metal-dependent hydrolase (beta-lactamase superfamily II)